MHHKVILVITGLFAGLAALSPVLTANLVVGQLAPSELPIWHGFSAEVFLALLHCSPFLAVGVLHYCVVFAYYHNQSRPVKPKSSIPLICSAISGLTLVIYIHTSTWWDIYRSTDSEGISTSPIAFLLAPFWAFGFSLATYGITVLIINVADRFCFRK